MDFDEYEDSRPRFVFQSRSTPQSSSLSDPTPKPNKPILITSLSISVIFLISSFFFLHSHTLHSLFLWLSLSLLVGPFAPPSLTGGDIRVGQGKVVEFPDEKEGVDDVDEGKKKGSNRKSRGKRSDFYDGSANGSVSFGQISEKGVNLDNGLLTKCGNNGDKNNVGVVEEKEWSEEDLGLLRKQIVKYPVGKPRRWEVIAEGFKGRHSVESVIKEAKGLGKAKPDDSDSYSKFLKDRKPDGRKVEGGNEEGGSGSGGGNGEVSGWSSSEDIALLNALKTFPKDVAMRWEKIAAAIPGKTKAGCMKRVAELKKDFRSSKASNES